MTLSSDQYLMTAILSMDIYNRDLNEKTSITPQLSSLSLGGATLLATPTFEDNGSGLGAEAWSWNGQTIIVYRGTDTSSFFSVLKSAQNGYPLAVGSFEGSQTLEAVRFYQNYENAPSLIVTGQSLGGGLAGFVGAVVYRRNHGGWGADVARFSQRRRVSFDLDDRNSIQEVDPANLEASYGPDVRLVRATSEVTDDPVTDFPRRRLP